MSTRKKAGHIINGKLVTRIGGSPVLLTGLLREDTRGTSGDGQVRDFSGKTIYTSKVGRLEYVEVADTTVVYTLNSIYFTQGNLIKRDLKLDVNYIEGSDEICAKMEDARD